MKVSKFGGKEAWLARWVPDGDEGPQGVNVAVLAVDILSVAVLLVGNVGLEPLVRHLVGVLVLRVGLERNIHGNVSLIVKPLRSLLLIALGR